jgi:hypothetical protein
MTRNDTWGVIKSLIEDCMMKQMYGSILIGIDGRKVQTVDISVIKGDKVPDRGCGNFSGRGTLCRSM